ncbi:MAG TPA: hypothetical protein VFZ03_05190 [Dongiaceae bacterium]
MNSVIVDFDRLLGYKLVVRAMKAAGQDESASGHPGESGAIDFTAIFRAKIGQKPVFGLRYRGT